MIHLLDGSQMKKIHQELQLLKREVAYIKEHIDEQPRNEYVEKIKKVDKRGKFIDVSNFSKEFGLR